MAARVGNITFDCGDALKLATFWSAVLDRPVDPGGSEHWAAIGAGDVDRREPAWFFEIVPEGKAAKNRMHLDLVDPDPGAVDRLVALGATVVEEHTLSWAPHSWTVLQDPEGNEFCLAAKTYGA